MSGAGRPRRWRRRLLWLGVALVAARLLLALLLPWLLAFAARAGGLEFGCRAAQLSLTGLSLQLDDVVLRDPAAAAGSPPLLAAEEVVADLAAWQLLRGRLVVVDGALTGACVHVVRGADGALQLPAAWQSPVAAPPPAADREPAAAPEPLRFELPLQVDSLRVHDLRLVMTEAATASEREFTCDAAVVDLGRSDRPATLRAHLHGRDLVDRVELRATIALRGVDAAIDWQLTARGLRPPALPWLDDPQLPPVPHVLGADLTGDLRARVSGTNAPPTVSASLHLQVLVDEREQLVADLAAGPSAARGDAFDLPLALTVHGDDLVESLRLETRLAVTDEHTDLQGQLVMAGLTLRRLQPWLAAAGVALPANGLDLSVALQASHRADRLSLALADLTLGSGTDQLVLAKAALQDLRTAEDAVQIAAIEIDGPQLGITRRADGTFELLGARLSPPAAVTATNGPTPAPAAAASPFVWPRLALDTLRWTGTELRFQDHGLPEAPTLVAHLDLLGERLVIGRAAAPGSLTARFAVLGSLDELRADFELTPTADSLAVGCRVTGRGVTADSLSPWLARSGLVPQLQNGSLRAQLETTVRSADGAIGAELRASAVRFEDGDEVLFGLRRVEGTGIALAAQVDLGSWSVDEPYVAVHRQTDGSLRAFGLRLEPAPPAVTAPPAAAEPATATAAPTTALVRHGPLAMQRAVLRWIDAGAEPAADLSLGVDLRLEPQAAATGSATAFVAALRLDPGIGTLDLHGAWHRSAAGGRFDAELTGAHLRGSALQPLLPPGLACTLADGSLQARVAAAWQVAAGTSLDLRVERFALRDQGTELLALDELDLQLPTISADLVHVAVARTRGLRAVAATTPAGLQLPGLQIAPARPSPPPAATAAATTTAPEPTRLPTLRIDTLELVVERFEYRERSQLADGEPLVASARLSLAEPWATADDPEQTAPCRLVGEGVAVPLCRSLRVEASLAPFALAPTLEATLHATGIDTTALARVHPGLDGLLTGTCADATFTSTLHGRLDLRRRDPRRFDFGNPFGGELLIEGTDLRATGSEHSLLHIDEIALDLRAFDPRTGDVLLRSVEIEAPQFAVENGPDGLECLGLRFAPPPAQASATPVAPGPRAAPAVAGAPELAIDRLQIQGLALSLRDPSTEPPTVLPLRDCDCKILNLSTRALVEPRPIAFTATLHGGDVELERRVHRSSVLAGLIGSATEAIAGTADRFEAEARPLVDEITISGQLQVFPQPKGQVRTLVHALELPALRGLAKTGGVDLADGVFDFELDARLDGARGVDLRLRPKFTWLSLSEPPGGPISTYLKLPAPLDTVLFALRNDDDEHVLPLQFVVPGEGLSGGSVAAAAAESLVRLIADAIASAAFRVGGAVTGAVGLGGGADGTGLTASLDFAAGDPLATAGSLDPLLAAAADDPELVLVLAHELGQGDLDRAAELASPPAAVVHDTVTRLRATRAELEHERAELAERTAALFGAGRMQDAWGQHRRLQAVDERLGALVRTQEEALRMSFGEHERAARRRTRNAAVSLATARLEAVRHEVQQRSGPDLAQRVEWRPPRGIVTAGLPAGGRVLASLRRRAAR